MSARPTRLLVLPLLAAILPPLAAAAAQASDRGRQADRLEGRYIVAYEESVARPGALSDRLAKAEGFQTTLRYRHALEGFAARLTPAQVQALRDDPRVASVTPDRVVHAVDTGPMSPGDSAPTGVRRIEAANTTTVHQASTAKVAVIDTGIDLNHTDLDNAVNGKDCTGSEPAQDDNGHGTHVAGTIAAENDGPGGVVGVAPGTTVVAVKVLNSGGSGSWSQVICGIDYTTGTRTDGDPSNDILVANMSLGGGGSSLKSCATTSDALHKAICNSTAAGVTHVVAAGNDGWDFDYAPMPDVPAAYPEVLTVTAVSDSDGLAGATGGAPTCRSGEQDDRYASFSNYAATSGGAAHTIAGPGVCILSDKNGGGLITYSGTSMATPHLAGAVALCLDGPCAGMSPAEIINKMWSDAESHDLAAPGYGFTGDPTTNPVSGRYYGYLSWVGMGPPPPPPPPDETPPTVTPGSGSPADGATGISPTTNVSVTFDEAMNKPATQSAFSLTPGGGSPVTGTFSWSGDTMTFDPSGSLAQGTGYAAQVGTGAEDVAGNNLTTAANWTFHTLTNVTAYPSDANTLEGTWASGNAGNLGSDDGYYYRVNSTNIYNTAKIAAFQGLFTGISNDFGGLKVTYKGKNSKSATQTVDIKNWVTGEWDQLDVRTVGDSEKLVEAFPATPLGRYVSGAGELLVRVRGTRCSTCSSFYMRGDLMKIAFTLP